MFCVEIAPAVTKSPFIVIVLLAVSTLADVWVPSDIFPITNLYPFNEAPESMSNNRSPNLTWFGDFLAIPPWIGSEVTGASTLSDKPPWISLIGSPPRATLIASFISEFVGLSH